MPQSPASQVSPPPPPPPPPPPMPGNGFTDGRRADGEEPTLDLISATNNVRPHMKMRTLNWRRIPKRKVLQTSQEQANSKTLVRTPIRASISKRSGSQESLKSGGAEIGGDERNVWFLIAQANKSIKEVSHPTGSSASTSTSKSASKIREMLESVRRRMAAVTANSDPHNLSIEQPAKGPKNILEAIDFDHLESLFCLNNQPIDNSPLDSESPNFIRRLSMRTNASSDSVISSNSYSNESSNNCDDDNDYLFELETVHILDSKKSLNVNIFLKQLKSQHELIEQINREQHHAIGKEKLESILKLLPDDIEQTQLMRFYLKNKQSRLPIAERFLLQLITEIPNVKLRIEFMLLQEEYRIDLELIGPELDKIEKASNEIRASKMLRDVLNLVLVTGNFLNTGGYAADAAGFSLDCLERLSEVRSNKQGVFLIHYVAEIASKLNLINFQQLELPNVELASRVCMESIKLDLSSMMDKIFQLKRDTDKEAEASSSDKTNQLYLLNLLRTLDDIKSNVDFLKRRITFNLEQTRKRLADYLCEDSDTFKLNECFHNILAFSQRLKTANEENERRQRIELSKLDRSNCSLRRSQTINHRPRGGRLSLASIPFPSNQQQVSDLQVDKRASIGISSRRCSLASQSGLSRTTSTFNVNSNSTSNSSSSDYDELHKGLMRLLDEPNSRRLSDCHTATNRNKILPFGTYRRASKLFRQHSPKVANDSNTTS